MIKKSSLFLILVLLIGCKSKQISNEAPEKPAFTPLNLNQVNSSLKKRTYELGKRVLMTCNTSTFKPFTSDEATSEVIQKINKDRISETCQNIIRSFGKFNDIKLIEVYRVETEQLTVFRYKCDYEKKYRLKELRITINDAKQITALTTIDWNDTFSY